MEKSYQTLTPLTAKLCLGAALLTSAAGLQAQTADPARVDRIEKENADLRKRLETLEMVAQKEGLVSSAAKGAVPVNAMSKMSLSGFVTASYFHDTSHPEGRTSPGYLWNRQSDSFSLNKVKLTLASPAVEASGDKWDAAYRASLIFGQDAPIVNSGSKTPAGTVVPGFNYLREAYVELNVPIGTGLNVKAGELISLLNYESGDGGAANDNFSQGYQWFYTGNGPAAGVQLGYTLSDMFDVKVRVQNGMYAGPVDNNDAKTVMAALGIKPSKTVWLSLIGFAGSESASLSLKGVSLLAGWQATEQLHFGTELDYFDFNGKGGKTSGNVYSIGGWASYDFTKKVGLALRAEYLSDSKGVDISGPLGFPANSGNHITSVALTLNYKPVPSVKIQPEVRYDHTSVKNGFGTKADRVILGAGVSYLF